VIAVAATASARPRVLIVPVRLRVTVDRRTHLRRGLQMGRSCWAGPAADGAEYVGSRI
jgi:hypothetical protein